MAQPIARQSCAVVITQRAQAGKRYSENRTPHISKGPAVAS